MKVIEGRAARVATNAGADPDKILGQLNRVWHRCWAERTERLTRDELASIFGRQQVDAVLAALLVEDFLCPLACVCTRCISATGREGGYRVGGAHKFTRLRKAFSEGGKNGKAASLKARALRAGTKPGLDPEIPRSRDPESLPTVAAEIPRSRDPEIDSEAFADYWTDLEGARQGHCRRVGVEPKGVCRCKPERQVQLLTDALEALELTEAAPSTWRDRLDDLLTVFLDDEKLGMEDRDGKERDQPWPLPVFLNPRILERLARDANERVTQ